MLDTKLKKSHKLTNLIIALIVLLPALLLVCLYPRMERAMIDRRDQWYQEREELKEKQEAEEADAAETVSEEILPKYYLEGNFVNYAVEASYYQYGMLLQKATGVEVSTSVLEEYGWVDDYFEMTQNTPYYAEYRIQGNQTTATPVEEQPDASEEAGISAAEGVSKFTASENFQLSEEEAEALFTSSSLSQEREQELKEAGLLGYLTMEFDAFGKLSNIRMHTDKELVYDYENDIYGRAKNSISQYQTNSEYFESEQNGQEPGNFENSVFAQVCPKNFRAIFLIYEDNERFVNRYEEIYVHDYPYYNSYYSPEEGYFDTGAYGIVMLLAVLVAVAALLLPCFKKLETGWEKLFCLPTEIVIILLCCGVSGAVGMGLLMSHSTMEEITQFFVDGNRIELLGYQFSKQQCYYGLLALNFLGWAACFFAEYICVAQLRQFFCGPMYYIKHRFIVVRFFRWLVGKCKKLVRYITDIDIHENLHKSILKIVLANLVVVTVLCCFWFAGIFGVLVYSFLLYLLLCKYGEKLQKQYQSILDATGQMAEGDLRISMDEDLGVFTPLGEELSKVQQGFSKAVAEEAKSQNMKSELITNVSHDLKTPLTAIITYVDLLKNPDITEEERQSYIETLDLKSQRLKVLIEDLFEVSKANSGNVKMNFMDVDIVNLMKEVRLELEDKIEQSNLIFRWNLPEEKVMLWLDGQRTYRIFENLLNNAMKYAMPFTRVYIDIVNKDSEVVICFKNMSAQELSFDPEHLTERFVRGDSSRNSEGSGLGLAIAKSFTELQHGEFHVSVDGDLFKVTIRFLKK